MSYQLNEDQEKWLQALESGEYRQAKEFLCASGGYCCLGVACVLIEGESEPDGQTLAGHGKVMDRLKLRGQEGEIKNWLDFGDFSNLAAMNDEGWSFQEIAAFIRANPEAVFTD